MILFFADYPEGAHRQDGAAQRILAIDQLFLNTNRTYIRVSLTRFWIPNLQMEGLRRVTRVNALAGIPIILYFVLKSKIIYIHSIYNAMWITYLLPWIKFIIDLHGVVPEEELQMGNRWKARFLGFVENICLRYAMAAVCVTRKMVTHLKKKHPKHRAQFVVLPIMQSFDSDTQSATFTHAKECTHRVVYSGGIQAWQNIERMIQSIIVLNREYVFEIYTPNLTEFRQKLISIGVDIHLESLERDQLYSRYAGIEYGFLLRGDDLVNRSACPTKLIEYLHFGIIPIVLQPEIGDMNQLGYKYILLEDFEAGRLPSIEEIQTMKESNNLALMQLEKDFFVGAEAVYKLASFNKFDPPAGK